MQVQTLKEQIEIVKNYKIKFIILNPPSLKNIELLSSTNLELIALAMGNFDFEIIDYNNEPIKELIKNFINGYDYVIILYSYCPLIQNKTLKQIVDYICYKQIKACKLGVGYAYDVKYYLAENNIIFDSIYSFDDEDFYVVENKKQIKIAEKILQHRIIEFHASNGVKIIGENVLIEPFVNIESSVSIGANNVLKGRTYIADGVILKENNIIENSYIAKGCMIKCSNIEKCKLNENVYVMPYCDLKNSVISANTTLNSYTHLGE